MINANKYDAVVIGAGPNGLAAAITIARAGLSVCVIEAKETIGGGMRTAELTLPGFKHDVCSAIHPTGVSSPFFKSIPLKDFGLEWIYPAFALAHPFDNGHAAVLGNSMQATCNSLGKDGERYKSIMEPFLTQWDQLLPDLLGPIRLLPAAPFAFARFGLNALMPADMFSNFYFKESVAKGFFAGLAAHSVIDLTMPSSSAIGLVLAVLGHHTGWPMPKGGSQHIANAMAAYLKSMGGEIITGVTINRMEEVQGCKALLFDTSPQTMMSIVGDKFSRNYTRRLKQFKPGPGVFKVDLALREPIPFTNKDCRQAGTVHLGSSMEEIVASEKDVWNGRHPEKPCVLLAQQSVFDDSRAPAGKHTAWAYCHVPNGSSVDMSEKIINQIERYAPGFRDAILGKHSMSTADLEKYNHNYTGGDINGGANTLSQIFGRPVFSLSPYTTPLHGVYLCSASTPPGGGVHGMSGYHAARAMLSDLFEIRLGRNPVENSGC